MEPDERIADIEPVPGHGPDPLTFDEALDASKLRTSTPPSDLTPEEESIVEDILASDAIQVRFKNWLVTLVLAKVGGVLAFIPWKKRILGFLYSTLLEEVDEQIDKFKERRRE